MYFGYKVPLNSENVVHMILRNVNIVPRIFYILLDSKL